MSKHTRIAMLAAAIWTVGIFTSEAAADTALVKSGEGMEPRLFRPAVDTKGHFSVDSTPVLPHLAVSLGLLLDFGFNQWVAVEQDDGAAYDRTLVNRYIATTLLFNFGLFDRVALGVQLPLIIPSGRMYDLDASGNPSSRGWSSRGTFGDLAFHAKLHVTRANLHVIGLGAVVQYQAPTGQSELLTGAGGGGAISGKVIVDVEPAAWYRAALNVGARYAFGMPSKSHLRWDGPDLVLFRSGPMLSAGLGQSFVLWPGLMDLVIEVYANQLATAFGDPGYTSLEANGGFKIYVEENSYLMAGYAHGIPLGATESGYGYQSVEHRMFLGFAFEPSMPDRDGDGIGDAEDQCPTEPEDRDGFEDSDGCPEADNDRDGIPDVDDECPLTPEDADGDRDEDGCPEKPADPEGDQDQDRIKNELDRCPEEPETYNGYEDEDGCPDEGDVVVTEGVIKTLKKIYFEYNSDRIKRESFPVLDTVAATIAGNPQIELIEVQGHADERGAERYNLKLTTRRARSVMRYLVRRGIKRQRLRFMGYGEYCPINLAHDEAAWEENRRVEFKVLKVDGRPTGVETACARARRKGIAPAPVQ